MRGTFLITRKLKFFLLSTGFFILTAYVAWYAFTYVKIRRQLVLSVSSQELNCPRDQITIGGSHQHNDGPSEIPVLGCGQKGFVVCVRDPQKYGIWREYFSFDLICSFYFTLTPNPSSPL